jgi:hypothetical protein
MLAPLACGRASDDSADMQPSDEEYTETIYHGFNAYQGRGQLWQAYCAELPQPRWRDSQLGCSSILPDTVGFQVLRKE